MNEDRNYKHEFIITQEDNQKHTVPYVFLIFFTYLPSFYMFYGYSDFLKVETLLFLAIAGIPVFFLGILIHELLHAFTWIILSRTPFSSIKFKFMWKEMAAYVSLPEKISARVYKIGAFMPALLMGFIPWVYSLYSGNILIFLSSLVFTLAAASDFLMLKLLKQVDGSAIVQDDPNEVGCQVWSEKSEIDKSFKIDPTLFVYSILFNFGIYVGIINAHQFHILLNKVFN